jgi:hypothetical protein
LSTNEKIIEEIDYVAYPNPTKGDFTIDLKDNRSVTITICNLVGQQVYQESFENNQQLKFNLNEAPGVYLVFLDFGNDKSVIKLVKE